MCQISNIEKLINIQNNLENISYVVYDIFVLILFFNFWFIRIERYNGKKEVQTPTQKVAQEGSL